MDISTLFNRKLVIGVAIASLAAAGAYYGFSPRSKPLNQRFITVPVTRGSLTQTVAANGTLNPVVLVNVGSRVSGVVQTIYADFNDKVKKGQVLLRLNPSLLQAQLNQSRANAANARASLDLARANEKRSQELYDKRYVSRQSLDTAIQAMRSAEAQLDQAEAQVRSDAINLNYTVIRSPVAGVVVSREVDAGQTVAASFQTPTLFKIAQDLTHMQIDSSFAEADIGGIRVGQNARFTVDAYPGRTFTGRVRQIRLDPTTESNVVTYNVVIDVDNSKGDLLPGMTAYVNVTTAELKDVVSVPNAALRFRPAKDMFIQKQASDRSRPKGEGMHGAVYILGDTGLIPVPLLLGASDGNRTQVLAGDIRSGEMVVTDVASNNAPSGRSARVRIH
ncbi:MAG TPA: efflux RND transporter periplasmic adaptor subunit [Mariprofundaceae bacterium]|nr:efflux RND transporter periplasmic adaptor subunit [Mariprofundaceae bacterium]